MRKSLSRRPWALALTAVVLASLAACGAPSTEELLQEAKTSMAAEDFAAATLHLKAALANTPNQPELRFLLGRSLYQQGDAVGAMTELNKALELDHPRSEVVPALANALLAAGQFKRLVDEFGDTELATPQAQSKLLASLAAAHGALGQAAMVRDRTEAALNLDSSNEHARLLQARLTAGGGELDQALAQVESLLADHPRSREAWQLKGEILAFGKGQVEAGTAAFRQAVVIEPRHLMAHASLIALAINRQDVPALKAEIAVMKQSLPDNHPEVRFYEAQTALIERDIRTARTITQQLLLLSPQNHRVLQLAGTVELNDGQLGAATEHFRRALQVQPQLESARRLLAQTQLRAGQADAALVTLQPLLGAARPHPDTLAVAGEAYLTKGQFAQAEALFKRASAQDPTATRLVTLQALAQTARGDAAAGLAGLDALAARDSGVSADLALISAKLRLGQHGSLAADIERLQAKLPGSALPHHLRGRMHLQRRELPAARASFEQALAADAGYFQAVVSLAQLDLADNKPDAAMQRFERLLQREPAHMGALISLMELRQRAGAPPESIRSLLDNAVKAKPDDPAPRLLQVEYLLDIQDPVAARSAAQQAAATSPNHPRVLDVLGRAQLAAGDVQQAISTFNRWVTLQPDAALAHLRLAEGHGRNNNLALAEQSLKRALELDPDSLPARRALVQMALARQKPDEALTLTRALLRAKPQDAAGYLLEADIHTHQRDMPKAITALRLALDRDRRNTQTAVRLHGALSTARRSAEADALAAEWRRANPRDHAFLMHLGFVALQANQPAVAEARFRDFLALRPNDAVALNNIAWTLLQQRNPAALAYAERANRAAPGQPALMDTLASALGAAGQWPQAIEWQRKAIDQASPAAAPSFRLNLAKLLQGSGDRAGARKELEALRSLGDSFPAQGEVAELLKTLG